MKGSDKKKNFYLMEYIFSFTILGILGALPPFMYGADIASSLYPYGLFYILYWALLTTAFVLFTSRQRRKTFEEPLKILSDATQKVASGDFSIYLKPIHTLDQSNHINQMFIHFNKMVEELGSLETMKTDFIASVSHEIKTPLSNIQGYAHMLQDDTLSVEERNMYLESLSKASHNLSSLVTNILYLSKLENQGIIAYQEPYNVCEQLSDIAISFVNTWEEKNLDFTIDIEDRATLHADPNIVAIIWRNLLSNASKFTEPGGSIVLNQTSSEQEIIVSVKDSGIGMDEATRKHVFEKFYQGDSSHSKEGNGLGLALVYRAVDLLDGTIEVESELGKGTTFTVTLKTMP